MRLIEHLTMEGESPMTDIEQVGARPPLPVKAWRLPLDPEIEAQMDRQWPCGNPIWRGHIRHGRVWFDRAKALGWTAGELARKDLLSAMAVGVVTAVSATAILVQEPDGGRVRFKRRAPAGAPMPPEAV
jgi:hypothetical protein